MPPSVETADTPTEHTHSERTGSGAVRVMGLSLERLSADAETGRALRAQLNSGVKRRRAGPGHHRAFPCFRPLSAGRRRSVPRSSQSIESSWPAGSHSRAAASGKSGRYQIAYGHRRLRACNENFAGRSGQLSERCLTPKSSSPRAKKTASAAIYHLSSALFSREILKKLDLIETRSSRPFRWTRLR